MNKKRLIIISIIITFVAVSGTAFARGPGWGNGSGRGWCRSFNGDAPGPWRDLTQDQKDQLKDLHQKFTDETAAIRAASASRHEEMRILMEPSSPDRTRLVQLSQEIGDTMKQLMEKQIDFQLEVKKIAPEVTFGRVGVGRGFGGYHGMGMRGFQRQFAQSNMNADCSGLQVRGSGNCCRK